MATERLDVIVLTGFLGSGKTTVLSSLLAHPSMAGTAVIVNELGDVPLDHHLVRQVDENTVVLASGCVCCSLRTDLVTELRDLLDRSDAGEIPTAARVVIETTGLADPAPIVNTILTDPLLRHRYTLAAVVTTIDATLAVVEAEREHEWTCQTAAADRICITKADITPAEQVQAVEERVRRLNPLASVVHAPLEPDAIPALLAPVPQDPRELLGHAHAHGDDEVHAHAHGDDEVSSFSLVTDQPLDWIAFGIWLTMLLQARGSDLLRVKGLLNVGSAGPVSLNGVQHVFHPPEHLDRWPDHDERTRVVFIGRALDRDRIEQSLAAFQAAAQPA